MCLCKCREGGQSGSRNHDACWVFQPLWTKTRDLSAASKRTMSHDVTTNDTLELPTGLPRMVSPHCTQGNDCKGGCRLVAAGRSCFCRQLGPAGHTICRQPGPGRAYHLQATCSDLLRADVCACASNSTRLVNVVRERAS